jgi:hypothetical protein
MAMDALFARYFDGDLSEREAREFLDAIAADPRLERELREYERMLALGKALPAQQAPAEFTERVMAEIHLADRGRATVSQTRGEGIGGEAKRESSAGRAAERRTFRIPLLGASWVGIAVSAAAVVLAYVGGIHTAATRNSASDASRAVGISTEVARTLESGGPEGTRTTGAAPGASVSGISSAFVNQVVAEPGLRYVRFAYVPADPSVQTVTVVGSFNDWDPEATPLRREDGAWTTILVLAPGTYEYMFLENGARWVTDPLAVQTSKDGFGGVNAVLDVES